MNNEFEELEMQQAEVLPERDALLGLGLLAILGLNLEL